MNRIPVELDRLGAVHGLAVNPANGQDGTQRRDRDERPLFKVQVLVTPPPSADGFQPKPSVEEVTVAAAGPLPSPMVEVSFEGLTARQWEMNGRSGISLSADSVSYARPARPGGGE